MRCDHDDDDHFNNHDHNNVEHRDHNDDGDDQKSKMLPFFGSLRYHTLFSALMMMTTNTASSVLPLVVSIETSREPLTANTTHSIACVR